MTTDKPNSMRNILLLTILLSALAFNAQAQKYFTKTGYISFYSEAPLEKIEAKSNQVMSILNAETGEMVFKVQIKTFQFEKALMQEHFNEKYLESDKYPDATFKGSIQNMENVDFSKDGAYEALAKGTLTIHGVSKEVEAKGNLIVKDGTVLTEALFNVNLADYEVKIPGAVKDNIAEHVQITVNATYTAMNK